METAVCHSTHSTEMTGDDEVFLTDCGLVLSTDPNYLYVCNMCDKKLAHSPAAVSHVSSSKHLRQLEYATEAKGNDVHSLGVYTENFQMLNQNVIARIDDSLKSAYKCLLCNVILGEKHLVQAHIGSNKHTKNLDWYQRLLCAIATKKFQSQHDFYSSTNRGIDMRESSYDKLKPFGEFIVDNKVIEFTRNLPECISVREWDYYCRLCDAVMNNEYSLDSHLQSQNHRVRSHVRVTYQAPIYTHQEPTIREAPVKSHEQPWQPPARNVAVPPPPLSRPDSVRK